MSAPELRAQVDGIITRIGTAQFYLRKAKDEVTEITQELLALDIGGSNSPHVKSANMLLSTIVTEIDQVPFDLSAIDSEMKQYREKL